MANTFELIQSHTLAGTQTTVTFSSIPQTYRDLYLVICGRHNTNYDYGNVVVLATLNGGNAGFAQKRLYGGTGTGSDGYTLGNGTTWGLQLAGNNTTANSFGNAMVYIANYSQSSYAKAIFIDSVGLSAASGWENDLCANHWSSTNAITSIGLSPSGGSFVANSTFYLYGIKNT
jgi:hypothetical protein